MSPTIPTQLVVVKTFKRDQLQSSPQLVFRMMRERYAFDVMSQLPHPFLVSFRFALLDTSSRLPKSGHVVNTSIHPPFTAHEAADGKSQTQML